MQCQARNCNGQHAKHGNCMQQMGSSLSTNRPLKIAPVDSQQNLVVLSGAGYIPYI